MSYRKKIKGNVFDIAVRRIVEIYNTGGRVVCTFSGGKDSGVVLELARIAARITGRGPVEVFMLDDEVMYPGTFEYAERMASQKDIKFRWVSAREPMPAVWNRESPYWWIFDELVDPDTWVRQPPSWIEWIKTLDLYDMVNTQSFPPPKGKKLYILIGNRVEESKARMMSIHSASSFVTKQTGLGAFKVYPIYDWGVRDVWKAVLEKKWDYNSAYDVMTKMGMQAKAQRIAPPTMTFFGMKGLQIAAKAWPKWYDRVNSRIPGAKAIAHFGLRAVMPLRRTDESWQECYMRECVQEAPEWIRRRALFAAECMRDLHAKHSSAPFPDVENCTICGTNNTGSWKNLANVMYTGDPYSLKANFLPYVQPSEFRPEDTREWKLNPAGFR